MRKPARIAIAVWLLGLNLFVAPAFGSFSGSAQVEVRTTGTDVNGGVFDTGVTGFPTDGAATVATTSAPVFTSASYNFVAGDVGAWIYIGAGTNWLQGWYKIASVASNAATLTATIGSATLAASGYATGPSTVVGMATTASPTGATWGIDYSQQDAAEIAFTDMVIAATTTNFTSVLKPVGKNFVGNSINVTAGTGFTVQRVIVDHTNTITATCDKSLGTTASTGGTGNLGGGLLTLGTAIVTLPLVGGNTVHVKSGTYTLTSVVTVYALASSAHANTVMGYGSAHYDGGTKPLITTATNSTHLFQWTSTATPAYYFANLSMSNTAGTRFDAFIANANASGVWIDNCKFDGFRHVVNADFTVVFTMPWLRFTDSEVKNGTSSQILDSAGALIAYNYFHDNTGDALNAGVAPTGGWVADHNVFYKNTNGFNYGGSTQVTFRFTHNVFSDNTANGILFGGTTGPFSLDFVGNIFYNNTTAGVNFSANALQIINHTNAYGANGTNRIGVSAGTGDVTLTADPFTARASNNFAPNSTAGGGAALKQAGYPGTFATPLSAGTGYLDIGAFQSQAAAASTGAAFGFVQ